MAIMTPGATGLHNFRPVESGPSVEITNNASIHVVGFGKLDPVVEKKDTFKTSTLQNVANAYGLGNNLLFTRQASEGRGKPVLTTLLASTWGSGKTYLYLRRNEVWNNQSAEQKKWATSGEGADHIKKKSTSCNINVSPEWSSR